jgi:hypothetical protein
VVIVLYFVSPPPPPGNKGGKGGGRKGGYLVDFGNIHNFYTHDQIDQIGCAGHGPGSWKFNENDQENRILTRTYILAKTIYAFAAMRQTC